MFEIHYIVFLDLLNIYTDTKTIKIEASIANLQAHPVFRAAILNFEFLAGKPRATIWFPLFFNSAYSKTPGCKFSCFYPEVHDMAEKCHISAPLYGTILIATILLIVVFKRSNQVRKSLTDKTKAGNSAKEKRLDQSVTAVCIIIIHRYIWSKKFSKVDGHCRTILLELQDVETESWLHLRGIYRRIGHFRRSGKSFHQYFCVLVNEFQI